MPGENYHQLDVNSLTVEIDMLRAQELFSPLFEALGQGKRVLVHCINGCHRSAQVAATSLRPFMDSADMAMNEVTDFGPSSKTVDGT